MSARGARRGFILAVVLILGAVAGSLALLMHQGMLHRAVQVRRAEDQAAARFLARGALNALQFGVGEAILRPPGVAPSTKGPELYSWLLAAGPVLARGVPRGDGDDDRAWLASVLGTAPFAAIDKLARRLPDARVAVFAEVAVAPAQPGPVVDPVVKRVSLRLRAVARVRTVEDALGVTLPLAVYSELPVAAKFTLAARAAAGLATAQVTADGGPWTQGDMPVVLIHHPSDGDPVAHDPFARGAGKPLVARSVAPSEIVTAHADRGLVWLAGPEHADVHLPLAAGGAPLGEEHALYAPHEGKRVVPVARALPDQPVPMRTFEPPDPLDPDVKQAAFVQGTVVPLSVDVDATLLGPNPDPAVAASGAVSRLKVHGTAAMPSPTAVIGAAYHTLGALSAIACDRDATDADERAQAAAVGRPLPVRDAREPFLAFADEAGYETDLIAERSSTEPSYGVLRPFGRQGEVQNQNAYVDLDGDGIRETAVSSEIGHEIIHLDLSFWKYGNLFASYAEYRRLMSRYISIPVNLSLELAGRPAEQAQELLRQAAFGKTPPGGWSDWLVTRLTLAHRDPLHQEPRVREGGTRWLDSGVGGADALATALAAPTGERWPGEPAVVVRGQRAFEEHFMPGGVMDLAGLRVIVVPAEGETVPGLSFERPVAVKPGSGGVLEVPRLACPGLVNGDAGAFAPLVVRATELVLTARGPYEAAFHVESVVVDANVDHAVIRGALSVGAVPAHLARPLVVAWDPRLDPVGPLAHLSYRVAAVANPRTYGGEKSF